MGLKGVGCALVGRDTADTDQSAALALYALGTAVDVLVTSDPHDTDLDGFVTAGLKKFNDEMGKSTCVKGLWTSEMQANVGDLRATFRSLYYLQRSLRRLIEAADTSAVTVQHVEAYMQTLYDVLNEGMRVVPWPTDPDTTKMRQVTERVGDAITVLQRGAQAYEDFQERRYSRGFVEMLAMGRTAGVTLPESLVRWGPFLADVAQAKSADELESAVNSILAPVGTFREKRTQDAWTTSIASYAGVRGGLEGPLAGERKTEWFGAPSALVGMEVSYGLGDQSVGLLVSVIDVGAYLNYGFSGDQDLENRTEVTLDQVFTPGVFLTLGISKRYPLSFALGGSILQNRRQIVDSEGSSKPKNMWQLSFLIGLDVPLVTF